MNQKLFVIDKELSESDKRVYFSFLFDVEIKESNYRRHRRKIIVLLVASLGMLALIGYRATQSDFKLAELIAPLLILALLAMQLFFNKKDTKMYHSFVDKYKDQPVNMKYQVYENMLEVYLGHEYVAYTYQDIYKCKLSKNGIFIELKNQDKKRISIIMRSDWENYAVLLKLLQSKNIHIKQYETSIS